MHPHRHTSTGLLKKQRANGRTVEHALHTGSRISAALRHSDPASSGQNRRQPCKISHTVRNPFPAYDFILEERPFLTRRTMPGTEFRSCLDPSRNETRDVAINHVNFPTIIFIYSHEIKEVFPPVRPAWLLYRFGPLRSWGRAGTAAPQVIVQPACTRKSHSPAQGFWIFQNNLDWYDTLFYEMTSRSFSAHMFLEEITC